MIRTSAVSIFLCAVLLVFISTLPRVAAAALVRDDVYLDHISLANTRDDLLAYFRLENAFNEKNIQAVENGISTSFTFYIILFRTSNTLFAEEIVDIKTRATIQYNIMKQEYTVVCQWKDGPALVTKSLDEARRWMTEVDNLKVVSLNRLLKGERYQIRFKAELEKVTLPLWLHHVLFFVSYWDVATQWHVVSFTY